MVTWPTHAIIVLISNVRIYCKIESGFSRFCTMDVGHFTWNPGPKYAGKMTITPLQLGIQYN